METNTGVYSDADDTGTDPASPDSDGDGLPDGAETNTGTYTDASDTGTDPTESDSDGDGFGDGLEVASGSDPTDAESTPAVSLVPTLMPLGLGFLAGLVGLVGAFGIAARRRGRTG